MSANAESKVVTVESTVKFIAVEKFHASFVETVKNILAEDLATIREDKSGFVVESACKMFVKSYDEKWDKSGIALKESLPLVSAGLGKTAKTSPSTLKEIPFSTLKNAAENILEVYNLLRTTRTSLIKPEGEKESEKLTLPE